MALVDYSSDSSSEPDSQPDQAPAPALPPLPSTFHDLYAHTVRPSASDDPSLHQGRIRQTPHVAGNWPSHLYVEWRPPPPAASLLSRLVADLQHRLPAGAGRTAAAAAAAITSFLSSDLGAPLPLHVSLSRPFVLSTAEKDAFLERVGRDVRACGVRPFELGCRGVEWHRTEESGRSFLVLRLRSLAAGDGGEAALQQNANPELTELLESCNAAVGAVGQPELYRWAEGEKVGDAFHISIAWSLAELDQGLRDETEALFNEPRYRETVEQMRIPVNGIKTKIGNVVTHIPLSEWGHKDQSRNGGSPFGS